MMITRLIHIILFMSAALGLAARSAADFFVSAPTDAVPFLTEANKLDMLDYFRFGSDRATSNTVGGESRVTAESNRLLNVELSKNANLQIAVLASGSDTIIAVVTTMSIPFPDSSLKFYDADWKQLKKSPVAIPEYTEWFTVEGRKTIDDYAASLPFIPAEAVFDSDVTSFTIYNRAKQYMAEDEYREVSPFLIPSVAYTVDGIRIKPVKIK